MADEIDTNTQTPQTEPLEVPKLAPEATSEAQTAQIPSSEPLATEPELIATPEVTSEPLQTSGEVKAEPEKEETEIPESKHEDQTSSQSETQSQPTTPPQEATPPVVIIPPVNKIRELLAKARNAIQFRKRKKLEKIMNMFTKRTNVTNDEVEKLLHVSDATATRYLTILKKENKIKQSGKTGKGVSYSKI